MMIDYSIANAPLQKELSAGKSSTQVIFSLKVFTLHSLPCLTLLLIYLLEKLAIDEVGNTAAFLASPLASAITGAVIYVDNGLNAMGVGIDSPLFKDLNIPKNEG